MGTLLRVGILFSLVFFYAALPSRAQCVGLPTVTALGSNKIPAGLCAPVEASVTYAIAFAAAVPAGDLEVVYDWGDGTAPEVISLVAGSKTYNVSRAHTYPAESDCEYSVSVVVRYNQKICTNTLQLQKIASWRTDAFNGGDVNLLSPDTKTDVHLVCEGEDIAVAFNDNTNWNCNTQALLSGEDPIESPNTEYRWQQIVYNTPITEKKIPNVAIDDVPVTGAGGVDLLVNYQDPRGVFFMSAPVLVDDSRRRSSLKVTAPGGFGAGFPKAGDVFAVTVRYWNFCNPYDDPEIPGPPTDLVNGDHPPVEKTALIKVVAPPPALKSTDEAVCSGATPSAFSVSAVTSGNLVNWYQYVPGSNARGDLIASGTTASLPVTSHPDWQDNKTPGVLRVWVTQRTNTSGTTNCESAPILVSRTIREDLVVPDPLSPPPAEICNGQLFTVALASPATETIGGATHYVWDSSEDITMTSSTASSATFAVNVINFGAALYVDRTITVNREYTSAPTCPRPRAFTIRIYRPPVGGTLSGQSQVCEIDSVGTISLTGHIGTITRWEFKKDDGSYTPYSGESSGNTISPGMLSPGIYTFRAILDNGPCNEVYSSEQNLEVFADPGTAHAGDDQFICNALQSAALNASFPESGKGLWTYESSVPAGLPSPSFTANDPNTSVRIDAENAGVYMLRWTITNGSCQSYDDVVIDFGTNPTDPDAGVDKTVCGPSTTLEGNVPEKGLGSWGVVNGPNGCTGSACGVSIATPSSATSAVELSGTDTSYGVYTFRWTISSGGNNCFIKTDDVTITFEELVTVNAEDVTGICLDKNNPEPIRVSGSISGPVTAAQWVNVSGTGSISASTLTTTTDGTLSVAAIYQPSTTDYDNGVPVDVKLTATPLSTSCAPVEKVITLHLEKKPVAYAGSDLNNICESFVSLNATPPATGKGSWSTAQAGVTFDDPADPKTIIRNLPVGTTLISWTVTSANGNCTSSPSSITLTRVTRPDARDLTITECEVANSKTNIVLTNYENDLTSLAEINREIAWYRNEPPPGGVAIASPSTVQTDVANGQVYVARIRDMRTGCTSDSKLTVLVRTLPDARNAISTMCEDVAGSNIVSDIDLSEASFVNAVTAETNAIVAWYNTESDAIDDRFPIVERVMVNGQKEFFAKIIYTDDPRCYSLATLNIVVNPQPAVTNIIGRESVCQGASSSGFESDLPVHVYQVAPISGAKYHWAIPDDPDTQFKVFGGGGENDFYVLLQFPNVYTGKIKVSAELNGCSGPVIEKQISVSESPAKPLIDGPAVVCENDANIAFNVSPNNSPSSVYNWEIRKVSDNSPGGAYIMEGQLTGNVLVNFGNEDVTISVRENNTECVSPVATKAIKVSDPPKATAVIERVISCFMESDGVIKTEVAGGTAPFSAFEIAQTGQLDPDNDGVFEQLPQGSYSIRMKDANGCFATSNVVVLKQPQPVTIDKITIPSDANGYNVSCQDAKDGEINVKFSGGNAGTYTVSLVKYNSSDAAIALQGTESVTFTGLGAGTYSLVAEDALGCSSIPSVAFVVSPPHLYAGAIGTDQVICSGEDPAPISQLAPAQGGTGSYEYEWQESLTGNVYNDDEWTTITGQSGTSYDPPVLSTTNPLGEQRYYRMLVKTISWLTGEGQPCAVKGKTDKVTITVNPLPTATLTSRTAEVCEGDAVALDLRLTNGKAPITFDYSTSSATFANQTGPTHTVVTLADHQRNETLTLLQLKDANGCRATELPDPVEVKLVKVDPEFSITNPDNTCNGGEYTFTWTAAAQVDYRWEWSDGNITELRAGSIPEGTNHIRHVFYPRSSSNTTEYVIKLFASRAGCLEKVATHSITIAPAVALNILAGDTLLCSGEQITFYNNSSGVERGAWYYRVAGSDAKTLLPKNDEKNAAFVFENTTTTDPLVYEVTYEAENNSGCKEIYHQHVYVYRSNRASFQVKDVPAFDGEAVNVRVDNTSEAIDEQQFSYYWVYGDQGFVKEHSVTGSFDITYYSPGTKDILLSIANIAAQKAGTTCESTFRKQITIPVNKLEASFTATPFASCAPVKVQIQNTTTGADTFLWNLYRSGTLITTSKLRHPEFQIHEPGIYDIYLVASHTGTGQQDDADLKGIQVLKVPHAAFELRSHLIYVPDIEMQVWNFSMDADHYEWHFGDGNTSDAFEPAHAYLQAGKYNTLLRAGINHERIDTDGDGTSDQNIVCYDSAQHEVTAINGGELRIPNAFTPDTNGPNGGTLNNEGFNDVFLPAGKGLVQFHMQIYDRWGTLIFESNDMDRGWDGYDRNNRLMPAGVYIYKVVARTSKGEDVTRAGDVTLIR